MSRREFLKQLSVITAASALGFGGGKLLSSKHTDFPNEKPTSQEKYTLDPYKGCQTSGFEFSVPLPFDFHLIDELVEINKTYKQSKVTTLFNSLPTDIDPLLGFLTTNRAGINPNVKTFDDYAQYVKYAMRKGFKVVYLLNSPKPFTKQEYEYFKPQFENLLSNLKKTGCYNIKVANQQLLEIFKEKPEFNILASTSFEYQNIRQMENFFNLYPNVKTFNLTMDLSRNIPMLKNLREKYKNVTFELIVDDPCLYGCPAKMSHTGGYCFIFNCDLNNWNNICRSNVIWPWYLDLYNKIGYKNFKLLGNAYHNRGELTDLDYIRKYFTAIEKGIGGLSVNELANLIGITWIYEKDRKLPEEVVASIPDLNYFVAHGDKCITDCEINCTYCQKCADKINKILA